MANKKVDSKWYLDRYPDVKSSNISAQEHYEQFGKKEGRFPYPPTPVDYLVVTMKKRIYGIALILKKVLMRISTLFTKRSKFDKEWYLEANPDVAASGIPPQEHYEKFGKAEGRLPFPPKQPSKYDILIGGISAAPQLYGGKLKSFRFLLGTLRKQGLPALKRLIIEIYYRTNHQDNSDNYAAWCALSELNSSDFTRAKTELKKFPLQPKISVVLPTYNSNLKWLEEAIESVIAQPYDNWELCIADDASTNSNIRKFLTQYQQKDSRIKVCFREKNGHISLSSNSAAELATGDWILLFDHDDLLHPFAFYWVVRVANESPNAMLIYSDEDKISETGNRHSPYFKSDWNYDLFLSQNSFSHLGLIKTELFKRIGGFRKGFEGSQDHDLILRAIELIKPEEIIHIPKVLYHWRVHAESTAKSTSSKPYAAIAGERAISDHLARTNNIADVSFEGYGYRVKYRLPDKEPLVSLIIPTRNGLHLIKQCIESIEKKTLYKNYEIIIVDNGSDDKAALEYFEKLKDRKNFTLIRDDRPFNYSQLNNMAAKHANGELLALINNDIEVISPEWLGEMVSHGLRPNVGAVGAKLLFPDNRLQHGGVILGIGGVANHAHLFIEGKNHGYFARASVIQQLSAVTAACLLVKKSVYDSVGGLDEKNLTVAFNDVDFCIRLNKAGFRNIWTPYALLYHHESATRGQDTSLEKRARFIGEVNYMLNTWEKELANDPFYNPNLNMDFPDFKLHKSVRIKKWSLKL